MYTERAGVERFVKPSTHVVDVIAEQAATGGVPYDETDDTTDDTGGRGEPFRFLFKRRLYPAPGKEDLDDDVVVRLVMGQQKKLVLRGFYPVRRASRHVVWRCGGRDGCAGQA